MSTLYPHCCSVLCAGRNLRLAVLSRGVLQPHGGEAAGPQAPAVARFDSHPQRRNGGVGGGEESGKARGRVAQMGAQHGLLPGRSVAGVFCTLSHRSERGKHMVFFNARGMTPCVCALAWQALGVEATPAADAQPPSISDASTSTSSVEDGAKRLESAAVEVVQELGEAAAAPAAAQEPPQPPRKRWIARVWKALRRVRGRAKARAAAAARAATAAAAALAVVVESAESPESADAAAAFDDDELDHADELLEGTAAAAAATAADPDHPASAPEPRFEEVFSVRGSLIRGFRNAGNGDV